MRRYVAGVQGVVRAVMVLVLVVLVNMTAERTNVVSDLTPERRLTFEDDVLGVVRGVRREMKVTAFVSPGPVRDELGDVLRRIRRENRRIEYRFVDPDVQLDEVARFGIRYYGTVVLESGQRREDATSPALPDILSAVLRLQRSRSTVVCFTSGHGERTIDDESAQGLALLASLLERNGYRSRTLATLGPSGPPKDCGAIVLAGPRVNLDPAALSGIRTWSTRQGRLLWLADPLAATNVDDLARSWGIRPLHGLAVENDPDRRLAANPLLALVPEYQSANPVVEGLPGATVYPQAAAFSVPTRQPRDGLYISVLAETSPSSYLVHDPTATTFDPDRDVPGPLALAVAADESRQVQSTPARVERSRLVAFASVDLASNLFIGQYANQLLIIRALNWMTEAETLAGLRTTQSDPEEVLITSARYRSMVVVNAVAVPLVVLAAGVLTWWWRRRRA